MNCNRLAAVNHIVDPCKGEYACTVFCEHGEIGSLLLKVCSNWAGPFRVSPMASCARIDVLLFADVEALLSVAEYGNATYGGSKHGSSDP